jgi:hypothetical protein
VAYESRTVIEEITEALGTVTDNLKMLAVKAPQLSEDITLVDDLNYTRTTSIAPSTTAFPEAEGYGAQATVA